MELVSPRNHELFQTKKRSSFRSKALGEVRVFRLSCKLHAALATHAEPKMIRTTQVIFGKSVHAPARSTSAPVQTSTPRGVSSDKVAANNRAHDEPTTPRESRRSRWLAGIRHLLSSVIEHLPHPRKVARSFYSVSHDVSLVHAAWLPA